MVLTPEQPARTSEALVATMKILMTYTPLAEAGG